MGEDDNNNNNNNDDDDCGEPTMTRVFEGKEMTSTVKVTAIETEDDIDDRVKRRMLEMNKKKKQDEEEGNESVNKNHKHHKLTKKALSVLTNTKMKLQGKKKFAGSAKQVSKGGKKNLSGKDSHRRGKKK